MVNQSMNTHDRTLNPGVRELADSDPLLEGRGCPFGGDLRVGQAD